MKFLLHARSRYGNAHSIEIRYPKKENEQPNDAMPRIRGVGHHPLSHGCGTPPVVIRQVTTDAYGSALAGPGRIGPEGEQSMPNLHS